MAESRNLGIRFTAKNDATRAFQDLQRNVQGLQATVSNVAKAFVALRVADIFKDAGGAVIGFMSQMEQANIAFKVMTGSVDDAREHIADLKKFAKETPFQLGDLVAESKRLQAYGIEVQNVVPTLKTLGDIAAGVGMDKLPQITLAFGQIRTAGRLFGTELRQMTDAGVPLIDALAEHFGVPEAAIRSMVEEGKVGFADVQTALQNLTTDTGKFANMMKEQSRTFAGAMSNIRDALFELGSVAMADIFASMRQSALDFQAALNTNEATEWANGIRQAIAALGEVFGSVFGAIGDVLDNFLATLGFTGDGVGNFVADFRTNMQHMHETAIKATGLIAAGFVKLELEVKSAVINIQIAVTTAFDAVGLSAVGLYRNLANVARAIANLNIPGISLGLNVAAGVVDSVAAGIENADEDITNLKLSLERVRAEAAGKFADAIGGASDELAELAEKQAAAGRAAGDAKPKIDKLSAGLSDLGKAGGGASKALKEAAKSISELLAAALALDEAMPSIRDMVGGGDLDGAAEMLVALGESAESAVSKVISIMKDLRSESEQAAKDAAKAAQDAADAIAEAAQRAADAWRERSDEMARSIIDALKAGKDWAAGTADFFRNEWLAGLEERIKEFAQAIRNAMRDGLDITDIVKEAEPLLKAYQDAQKAIKDQAEAAQKAIDDLSEAQRHNAEMAQEWIRQLSVQADFEFQERLRAQKRALDDYAREVDKEIAKIRAFEESQRSKAAARAANKQRNVAETMAGERIAGIENLLGASASQSWWVDGLRDALRGMVVNSYLDGKNVSRELGGNQQRSASLLAAMGGFA